MIGCNWSRDNTAQCWLVAAMGTAVLPLRLPLWHHLWWLVGGQTRCRHIVGNLCIRR